MKKIIALIITIAMLLAIASFMVACGQSGTLEGEAAESVLNELEKEESKIVSDVEQAASDIAAIPEG